MYQTTEVLSIERRNIRKQNRIIQTQIRTPELKFIPIFGGKHLFRMYKVYTTWTVSSSIGVDALRRVCDCVDPLPAASSFLTPSVPPLALSSSLPPVDCVSLSPFRLCRALDALVSAAWTPWITSPLMLCLTLFQKDDCQMWLIMQKLKNFVLAFCDVFSRGRTSRLVYGSIPQAT